MPRRATDSRGAPPPAEDDGPARIVARAEYMMGDRPAQEWGPHHAIAWEGMLEVVRRLRRGAEARLEERHGLGISTLGVMGRLERTPDHTLRQTDLAGAMGLSLSRVSRTVDHLQDRGLVERHPCPADARATNITLTEAGRALTLAAQRTTFAFVHDSFAARLTHDEMRVLAGAVTTLLAPPSEG